MANNESRGSPRDITRLIVGLLFGSGISGLAIGMIQGAPDVRPWGMAVFVLCLIAAGLLFWFGEWFIERREKNEMRRLGSAFGSVLDNIVGSAPGYSDPPSIIVVAIAKILKDEKERSLKEDNKADWVKVFTENTQHIIDVWEKEDIISSRAGRFEEDTIPEMEDAIPETES